MAEDDLEKYAKTAQAIAQAADTSVDAIGKLGSFIDRALGNIVTNGVGLIGDKLAYYRLERAIELKDKVDVNLKKKGIEKTKYVPANFGLPLIEKATIEDNDSMHDRWANLLTNAMDPNYDGSDAQAGGQAGHQGTPS